MAPRWLSLLAGCLTSTSALPAAPFVGTVAVGTPVDCPGPICSTGKLVFAPVASKAALVGGPGGSWSFTADLEGDYLVTGANQEEHYWRAITLPPPPPAAPDPPAVPIRRFSDGFHRQIASAENGAIHTDSRLAGWSLVEPSSGCVYNDGKVGLQLAVTSCPGIETSANVSLPAMFNEPLTLQLGGLHFPPGKPANLQLTFSELVVKLAVSSSGAATATVGPAARGGVAANSSADTSKCDGEGLALTLHANSLNCTLELSCSKGVSLRISY